MIISTGYGVILTPSENSDIAGNTGSPAGPNSSLQEYNNVNAQLTATTYVAPSSTANAIYSSQLVQAQALRQWNENKTNYKPIYNYGPNL